MNQNSMQPTSRREFLKKCCTTGPVLLAVARIGASEQTSPAAGATSPSYDPTKHFYGMLVNSGVCIGCGLLVIGVPYSLLWGLLAACLRFVPYFGAPTAAVAPLLLASWLLASWLLAS